MIKKVIQYLSLANNKAKEGHKKFGIQIGEIALLLVLRRLGPGHYFECGMYECSRDIAYVLDWINEKQYQRICRILSDSHYFVIARDKRLDKAVLSTYGIPTPRYLGYLHAVDGISVAGESLRSIDDLISLIRNRRIRQGVVLKPITGFGGRGVQVIKFENGESGVPEDGSLTELEATSIPLKDRFSEVELSVPGGWVVEEVAQQHQIMSQMNSSSLNTIRVILVQGPRGGDVLLTMLRVGRAGSAVDNTSKGGIACKVDSQTGVVIHARLGDVDHEMIRCHPDSGVELVGVQIPFWPEVISIAKGLLRIYPGLGLIGCDIGVGPDGAFVVETNHMPDKINFAYVKQPNRQLFRRIEGRSRKPDVSSRLGAFAE